jgi:two-component system, OmpR family, sensor kinase
MSLKLALVLAFSLLLTLIGLAAAGYSYHAARQEAWDLLDLQQQQISRFVGNGSALEQSAGPLMPHDSDEDYVVRIQFADGRQPRQSSQRLEFPEALKDGFVDYADGDATWRIYTRHDPEKTVSVAQKTAERNELAADAAFNTALPFFAALPWVWAIVYWMVGSIMRRIETVASEVEKRRPDDDTALPVDTAPVEIRPLIAAINRAFARVNEMMGQQRDFLANAAHEMRTPLAALSIHADNLSLARSNAEWQARASDVQAGIHRLSTLTSQLLALARQDAGGPAAKDAETALHDAVLETVSLLYPLAEARGIDLGTGPIPDLQVAISAPDLQTLLQAIVHNAIHHSNEGAAIDIHVVENAGMAIITVTDNGPGIAASEIDRVFERFARHSQTGRSGSGLGLAIAKAIVVRHHGTISLKNRQDANGLLVTMKLPLATGA